MSKKGKIARTSIFREIFSFFFLHFFIYFTFIWYIFIGRLLLKFVFWMYFSSADFFFDNEETRNEDSWKLDVIPRGKLAKSKKIKCERWTRESSKETTVVRWTFIYMANSITKKFHRVCVEQAFSGERNRKPAFARHVYIITSTFFLPTLTRWICGRSLI